VSVSTPQDGGKVNNNSSYSGTKFVNSNVKGKRPSAETTYYEDSNGFDSGDADISIEDELIYDEED